MQQVPKAATLDALGLPSGDHWVKFHIEGDSVSFEIAASRPLCKKALQKPTGFVRKWGGSARKCEDSRDSWLTRINEKHLG